MLRAAFRQIVPDSEAVLEALGIDPKSRAEELPVVGVLPPRQCASARGAAQALELGQQASATKSLRPGQPRPALRRSASRIARTAATDCAMS